jgi:hypothetical protein
MAKEERIINIFVRNIRKIYCRNKCFTQVLWMTQTLQYIEVEYDDPIPILCDNTSAIDISQNLAMHSKMKYILINFHFIWELVTEKKIKLEYIGKKQWIVDIFTKPI